MSRPFISPIELPDGTIVANAVDLGIVHVGPNAPTSPQHGTTWVDTDDVPDVVQTGYRYLTTVYFTASGTFDKTNYTDLRAVKVRLVGGGGGSGGSVATGAGQVSIGRGGGGAGYGERFITADLLAASETVTVGAAGAAGAANGSGSTGGDSSFGPHVTGFGGGGGPAGASATTPAQYVADSVPGGGASGGDLLISGGSSEQGYATDVNRVHTGQGGGSQLGFGGRGRIVSGTFSGHGGANFGAGASAGANGQSQSTAASGAPGGPGIVIVEVYV